MKILGHAKEQVPNTHSSVPIVPTCLKFFSIMISNPFPKFFSTVVPTLQDHEL